jgi:protein phosphatase
VRAAAKELAIGREPTMTRLVRGAIRNLLRVLAGGKRETSNPRLWTPIFEESTGRTLSAPAQWLCAVTDVGKQRPSNEDGYFLSADCRLWIVADGMGGHAAGGLACTLTIEAIAEAMDGAAPRMPASLIEAFGDAQQRVEARGRDDAECQGMGSTVIAGIVQEEALHVCHVGDTRGYHFSQGQLRRLTNDHSLVWNLVRSGLLTPDQARVHPQRGRVTQAIGMRAGLQPDVTSVALTPGDRVLLCSDGLWEALADQDIGMIVGSGGSMMELASTLVDKANAASGQDNITAVLYEHDVRQR